MFLQQCEEFIASEDIDYEPPPIPDDFGLYDPDTAFIKYNFLFAYNVLPSGGGLNEQHPHDIHDLRVVSSLIRRLKWEKEQAKKEHDVIDAWEHDNQYGQL